MVWNFINAYINGSMHNESLHVTASTLANVCLIWGLCTYLIES